MEFQVVFNPKSYPNYWEVLAAVTEERRGFFGLGRRTTTLVPRLESAYRERHSAEDRVKYFIDLAEFAKKVYLINERKPANPDI